MARISSSQAGAQRATLWRIFEEVRKRLRARGEITRHGIFNTLAKEYRESGVSPFDFAVVDEAQEIGIGQLTISGRVEREPT